MSRRPFSLILCLFAALLVLALGSGCGGGLADTLSGAAERAAVPDGFVVIYDDHDTTSGGDRVELRADGTLRGKRWRPGDHEAEPRHWEGPVPERAVVATVALLVELRAWEQRIETDEARLNDQRARLTVRVGDEETTIWEWASDLEAEGRIDRVKQQLDALSFGVRHPMIDGDTEIPAGGI